MGKMKEYVMEQETPENQELALNQHQGDLHCEFMLLQKELLKHKYLYYVKNAAVISDYDYDMLEQRSWNLAAQLGFKADKWEDPDENEKDHVHHMVDFDKKHPLAKEVIEENK